MSNDSKSSLPPAVGEFAIEDRQRLLGRIAELEEALELADRGVANCELFRQRLAKYEDAEGTPIGTIAEQAREIDSLKGVNAHLRMQAKIQAQEARTQKAIVTEIGAMVDEPNDFLTAGAVRAALKAQPSGVVLPERRGESDNPAELMFNRGHDHALDEVTRLNSSPVSECGVIECETCGGAGKIDMRLGGYSDIHGEVGCPDCNGHGVIELSRAALTAPAPNHSEQVRAWRDVLAERQRQISAEGWTPEHDDEHIDGSLALAAAAYALWSNPTGQKHQIHFWPWGTTTKLEDGGSRRMLTKAGALILAEIERLDRAAPPAGSLGKEE